MNQLPKRRKTNGRCNSVDIDELTPVEVCQYAAQHGVRLNTNILALRRSAGKDPYIKRGARVTYTRGHADALIDSLRPRLIQPAEHREAS